MEETCFIREILPPETGFMVKPIIIELQIAQTESVAARIPASNPLEFTPYVVIISSGLNMCRLQSLPPLYTPHAIGLHSILYQRLDIYIFKA